MTKQGTSSRYESVPTPDHSNGIDLTDRTITVLLVDDDGEFAALVADYLEREYGFNVISKTSVDKGLRYISDNKDVSCIVSDYAMPKKDGLEFLEAVKAQYPDQPFVLFAGQGSEHVASRAIRLGADDYLEKDTGETRYELLASRITNCVTINRQQQKLEDLYAAIEHAGHAMFVTDIDGTITYANPTMADVSGYDLDELRGKNPRILKSGEHDQEFYSHLWETILNGDVWQSEVINEHRNGHQYVIDQTISPIQSDGDITGFVAINRDITVRKRRERNLTFFKQAVENIGTGIAAYNNEGNIRYVNEAYANMLGATADELSGRSITEVTPKIQREDFDDYWDSFETGETRKAEGIHQRLDDGRTFPVDTVTTQVEVGDETYHVGTIEDITERKERERELEMFQEGVEEAGHGVVVTDVDGTIEYVNPAFEQLSGYTSAEAIGNTPAILKSGEHDDEFYRDLWDTILAGDVWRGEIINERKDGTQFVIDQTISPLEDEDGEIHHFVAINRDITELKEQRRELQRQNERLENFGRTVAHDLRNPLSVMEMYLSAAQLAEDPEEEHAEMESAVERMTELIEELLALAEQGKTVLDPEPGSLTEVAETAWDHVDTRKMSLELGDDGSLLMDDTRVIQLFENLFRNAREHAGEDVTIRVGKLTDGFFVEDTGPGIPEEDQEDVLGSGFTTTDEGTGFGLAIVNQIADAHDWDVTVTDGSDGGARFEFRGVDWE